MEWTITEDFIVPDDFQSHFKKKLFAAVLSNIDNIISQPIQHNMTYTANTTQKAVLDQINKIFATETPVRHEKLCSSVHCVVCSKNATGEGQYIDGHLKVHRTMIQSKDLLVTSEKEKEAARLILLEFVNQSHHK